MKKNTIKILACLLLIIFILFISPIFTVAESASSGVTVDDAANLLTTQEEELLKERASQRIKNVNYNVVFFTYDKANGKSIRDYSDDYMDNLFPDTDNNIGFCIDMDDREIYINTMGGAIKSLSDSEIESALDIGYTYITDKNYFECLDSMASYCLPRLEGKYETLNSSTLSTKVFNGVKYGLIPSIAITVIVVFVLLAKHSRANKTLTANLYVSKDNYNLINKKERYNRSYETVIPDYYKPQSSSSGGGSSHSSSSGRSHGGGGRSF